MPHLPWSVHDIAGSRKLITWGIGQKNLASVSLVGLLKGRSSCRKSRRHSPASTVDYIPFDTDEKDINGGPSIVSIWDVRAYVRLSSRGDRCPLRKSGISPHRRLAVATRCLNELHKYQIRYAQTHSDSSFLTECSRSAVRNRNTYVFYNISPK
jgi:hypothetical protein